MLQNINIDTHDEALSGLARCWDGPRRRHIGKVKIDAAVSA